MISTINSQVRSDKPSQLPPNDIISFAFSLSNIFQGRPPTISKQKAYKIQQVEELKDLNRFFELVIKQNKKCKGRLLLHYNFYQ